LHGLCGVALMDKDGLSAQSNNWKSEINTPVLPINTRKYT